LNPIVARALRSSVRPRALLGLVGAAVVVLASARGLAPDPNVVTGLRVTPGYVGLCLAELYALLVVVTITAAAAIASERQERTWDALAASALSDTELVLGKAVAVLLPAAQLALLLVLAHLVYGIVWGAPWSFVVSVQVVFLGTVMGAAGLSLLCSAVCDRVVHAVALAAAAIVLGWFVALDGLARTWTITRFARVGHPLRLLDDLTTSSVTVEVAGLRALAFLLGAALGGGLACQAAIRLARYPVHYRDLPMPGLFRVWLGKTEHVWDDPVYWRACRSRGARRTLRIGGRLILVLLVVMTVMKRDPGVGGLWAQLADVSGYNLRLLIIAGMPLLCLRASVAIADERRRGMLAPLFLAGIGPAGLVWSKLKGALRPAVPLTAMAVIFWLADVGRMIGGFTEPRLWLASLAVLAAVGAGYFLAVSLGLLASAYAPSPRVALLAALGLLFAWNTLPQVVPHVVQWAWPGISRSGNTLLLLVHLIGGEPGSHINILTGHVMRFSPVYPASWAVSWVAVTTLAGVAAWTAAVFRMSREHGRPAGRPARTRPKPA
jgi:ABC-type transport system involved in multi-copper enzyme maturation permease subunit